MADEECGLGAIHPRRGIHFGPEDHAPVTEILIHAFWDRPKPQAISLFVNEIPATIVGNHG
jgi:hypothetical protein